jgi:ABC-type transport system involved in multi-copper enzyme maturation permease subunit
MTSTVLLSILGIAVTFATIIQVRIWNPSRTLGDMATADEKDRGVVRPPRPVWNSPIIWREMMTKAYGRKVIVIKLAYLVIAAAAFYSVLKAPADSALVLGMISPIGAAFVSLSLLTMLLVNAQGVTSLTSERDSGTLELLLVTDISAKEFIFGKLGGVLYNSKELILTPWLLIVWYLTKGVLTVENFVYISLGFFSLVTFAAMLGLHSGLSYSISRIAIVNSLGTIFFLFVGIIYYSFHIFSKNVQCGIYSIITEFLSKNNPGFILSILDHID